MADHQGDGGLFTIVTSFSPEGYERYGRECVESVKAFWPVGSSLICYWEGESPDLELEGHDLLSVEPCASFLKRHADNPIICGRKPHPEKPWRPKSLKEGYSFKFDAYKFSRKVFAVAHAAREVEHGKLFWVDADTVTRAPVTSGFLNMLLPNDSCFCYLPRPGYHSELGFVGYNLDKMETRAFIATYEKIYAEDEFVKYDQWDDCFIFDRLLEQIKLPTKPITHSSHKQPFDNSVLGTVMTHMKGNRKYGGLGWQ